MKLAFLRRHAGKLALPAILAITTLAALAVFARRVPDPVCEGKRLSEWLSIWGMPKDRFPVEQQEQAADAIRHLGSNAVPSLLAWIDYEAPLARHPLLFKLFQHLPKSVMFSSPVQRALDSRSEETLAQNAMDAFRLLGPHASCAIPELTRRITSSRPRTGRDRAIAAVSRLGQGAVPAMTFVLSDEAMAADTWLVPCIRDLGTNAAPLIPLIIRNLGHTNAEVARCSARMLAALKSRPDLAVPALISRLTDPRREVRWTVAESLGDFGRNSQSALTALTNALADPDPDVKRDAAQAITKITGDQSTP